MSENPSSGTFYVYDKMGNRVSVPDPSWYVCHQKDHALLAQQADRIRDLEEKLRWAEMGPIEWAARKTAAVLREAKEGRSE
jgi:hypothetical protein